jgi:hypothetical protein
MYVKTEVEGLVKDTESGAILNVDNARLAAYKKQKSFMADRTRDTERINKIENDINEIKQMLQSLVRDR